MPNLRELIIEESEVTGESIRVFQSLPKLEFLGIDGTKISEEEIEKIKRLCPKVKIVH